MDLYVNNNIKVFSKYTTIDQIKWVKLGRGFPQKSFMVEFQSIMSYERFEYQKRIDILISGMRL